MAWVDKRKVDFLEKSFLVISNWTFKTTFSWSRTTDAQRWNNLHCTAENSIPIPIFRYGGSTFCLPHRPNFSDIFDSCLHWVSSVRVRGYWRNCSNLVETLEWVRVVLKFICSEKVTNFCEISIVDLSNVVTVKSTVEISQNFVAIS